MSEAGERKLFKDWFDAEAAGALAKQIRAVHPSFDAKRFRRLATRGLSDLEFAGRIRQFARAMAATLPDDIPRALAILTDSLPACLPSNGEETTNGFLQWPVGQFIADQGLPHFDASMAAMIELTKRFSSEFAVRPFIEHRPEETFPRLLALTTDDNPHVRRWCSEGTRPRLPWGKKLRALVEDPRPIWPILEALKDDSELYVRRSVANNLNDIAKDHPAAVVSRGRRWMKGATEERRWLVKHGLRTLVKDGDPGALAVMGYRPAKRLQASLELHPDRISIGEAVTLEAALKTTSTKAQPLLVDYVVHYVRKGDKRSGKVFKWKTLELAARGETSLTKRHAMRPTTIRALYPGVHRVVLQVNGEAVAETSFELSAE